MRWGLTKNRFQSLTARSAIAAAALGAASVFLPHWDPDDHWATPDRHVVVIVEQFDDEPFDPTLNAIDDLMKDALIHRTS